MIIKGLQKTTLLDFPGKVACTVFTAGCNFRCPFCHNASLVLSPDLSDQISEDEFFAFLTKRKNILDGVCITGGEPLLQKDIESFIEKIKDIGLAVKLDTNGAYPERLRSIIDKKLVDYVAMDIKNSKEKYALTAGAHVDIDKITESVEILKSSDVSYEFRTTVVRELHSPEDMKSIGEWIAGASKYFLQSFTDSGEIIDEGYSAHSSEDMKKLLDIVTQYVPTASLRGI
ncbi:MAG: anaerobic ribonucleoside-triphosphate reductase activating protein [Clostridia bacterium]|nr:anaerobic ribonucleoside-triphosphate reductase activating protein [Clostridia bacterium]